MTATLNKPDAIEIPDEIEPTPMPLVRYSISDAWIAKAAEDFGSLIATDSKSEAAVRSALTIMVKARTGVEAEYKSLTADAKKRIEIIREEKNRVIEAMAPTEEHLRGEWDRVEAERAKAKREREETQQRAIQAKIDADNAARKAELDKEAAELKAAQDALAESKRKLDEQQAEIKAKADAEAALEREREEKARQERQKKEDEEREAQRQKDEAERKAAKARQDKIDEEQRARQAELDRKQKEIDDAAAAVKAAQEKADREEFQRQAMIEADRKAKEQAEADRIAAEEGAVKERERLAELKRRTDALAPDKTKLAAWASRIDNTNPPKVASAEAAVAVELALTAIAEIVRDLHGFAA